MKSQHQLRSAQEAVATEAAAYIPQCWLIRTHGDTLALARWPHQGPQIACPISADQVLEVQQILRYHLGPGTTRKQLCV